jgi:hypothetical protein
MHDSCAIHGIRILITNKPFLGFLWSQRPSQVRRESTPLTARLSPNGGHHHARPQRRVPTSRILSSIFLKTQHGGFPTLRPRQITNNKRICSPARPPSMLLTFADAHAMRPSGIQQIPYDANRSAVHPSDTSAADDRALTRCDMTTSSRKNKNKIRKNRCRIAVSDF